MVLRKPDTQVNFNNMYTLWISGILTHGEYSSLVTVTVPP
jgi:hypothetical protein